MLYRAEWLDPSRHWQYRLARPDHRPDERGRGGRGRVYTILTRGGPVQTITYVSAQGGGLPGSLISRDNLISQVNLDGGMDGLMPCRAMWEPLWAARASAASKQTEPRPATSSYLATLGGLHVRRCRRRGRPRRHLHQRRFGARFRCWRSPRFAGTRADPPRSRGTHGRRLWHSHWHCTVRAGLTVAWLASGYRPPCGSIGAVNPVF